MSTPAHFLGFQAKLFVVDARRTGVIIPFIDWNDVFRVTLAGASLDLKSAAECSLPGGR